MNEPANLDAEESVLGAMMLTDSAVEAVLTELEPDGERVFYRASHGLIYRAARSLHRARRPVDQITVAALLESKGKLADAGGAEHVHQLAVLVPAASNVAHYARIVREQWAKRRVAEMCASYAHDAANGTGSSEALTGILRAALDLEADLSRGKTATSTLADMAFRLEERVKNPPATAGIAGPFTSYPLLRGSRLYVLGGYTADGKTAAAIQFASIAASRGARVGFATVEMSEEQLFDRMVAGYGVPLRQVEAGRILPPYMDAYRAAIRELVPRNVELIDDPATNASSLARLQRARRYDLLIVDHLHQIVLDGKPDHRRQRLEDEVQGFVTLARTEDVPVLLLAQLSRQTGGKPFPRPTENMLRESGRIEQQAAVVSFVWRHRDERNQPTEDAELIVAKDRFGPVGAFPLRFHPELMRYEEVPQ